MTRVAFWKRDSRARTDAMGRDSLPVLGPYVGRTSELTRFERDLDDEQKVIIVVSGEYGLGKTTLLRRFQQTASASGRVTASTDTTGKGIPAMLESLAEQLEHRGRPLRSFRERHRTYRQRIHELETDPQAPKGLAALAAGTLAKGGVRAARHLPVAGLAFELVSEDVAVNAATELANYVVAKVGNKDEVELVLEPVPILTRTFFEDLRAVADREGIGLFLDVDDAAHRDVEAWLLEVVRERFGEIPAAVVLVVASPRELDRGDWVSFEARVDRIELGPLIEEEARLFLEQAGITNEAVVVEILRRSAGIPLSLAVLAAQRPETPEQVGDPNGTAVDGFLSSVGEPARRRLAVDGSVPRVMNRDVLGVVFEKDDVLEDFAWLTELPFLKDTEQGWVYSEPVREQLLQRSRRDAPQSWTRLHRTLAEYYERLATALALDKDEQALDAEWQRYKLETTYHALCGGARAALRRVLNGFVAAFAADRRFAQRYGAAIRQAGSDTGHEWLGELGNILTRGTAAIDSAGSQGAVEMFDELLDSGELEDVWRAKALDWRGYLAALQGDPEAALTNFNAALELEPDSAEYLLDRARTLQHLGRYEDALRDLDRAASVEPDNPLALMLRAETYQLVHRLDDALTDIEHVLDLQPKNAAAWMMHADVLQLKGALDQALTSIDRALAIEPENAEAWAAHGRVQQARGRLEDALDDLEEAVQRAPDNYGILSLRANLLGRAGKIEEAIQAIRELIERAPEFVEEYGAIVSSFPREELQRRSARFGSLAGLEDKSEIARQLESFAEGPESVVRVLEADLAGLEAQAHANNENIQEAIAAYGRALEFDPGRAGLWSARAAVLLRAERLEEALADTERAMELAPDNYLAVALRWVILARKGDLEGAAATARTIADHADEYVRQLASTARLTAVVGATPVDSAGPPASIGTGQAALELAVTDPEAAIRAVRVSADTMEAALLVSQGDPDGARSRYRHALELDPDETTTWIAKGQFELGLGNVDEAHADFDRAVETSAENPQAWVSRAGFHLGQGSFDDALADVDSAIGVAPTNYLLVAMRAFIFQVKGDFASFAECARILADHAEEYVDQVAMSAQAPAAGAQTSRPLDDVFGSGFGEDAARQATLFREDREEAIRQVHAEVPMTEALLLASRDDAEGAIAAWTRALELGGERVEWLLARGELRRLAGHPDEALADFERAIELDDDSAAAHGRRGQVLRALERSDEALAELDRALQLDNTMTEAYLERGELHRLGGDFAPALADFDRMVELNPDSAVGHGSRGQVLHALERPNEALAALDRSLEINDALVWARLERGELYLDMERWEDGEADFSIVLANDPENVRALVGHGRALLSLGRLDEALPDLDRAIEHAPHIAFSYGIRAEIHYLRRDTDGALADFARAAELFPEWSEAQSRLSETLLLADRPEEALIAIEAALMTSPDDAWIRYVRALAHMSLANRDAALDDLDAAIATAELRENGSDRPRSLLNTAVFRLARGAPGDEDEAVRLFDEVAPLDASHRLEVIRDLETLTSLRGSPTAKRIAAALASDRSAQV